MPAASRNEDQKNSDSALPGLVGNPSSRGPMRADAGKRESNRPEPVEDQAEDFYKDVGREDVEDKPQRPSVQPGLPPTVDYRRIQAEREKRGRIPFFTIYKSGQGYWTRIGTVAGAVLILLWSCSELFNNLRVWLGWSTATGSLQPYDPFLVGLTAGLIVLMGCIAVRVPAMLAVAIGFGMTIAGDILCWRGVFGKTSAPGLGILSAFVGAFFVTFGLMVFRLINQPHNVDFLIATDSEMKKVNWTTRAELIGATKVVIAFVILVAAFLFVTDILFAEFFKMITVLRIGPLGG